MRLNYGVVVMILVSQNRSSNKDHFKDVCMSFHCIHLVVFYTRNSVTRKDTITITSASLLNLKTSLACLNPRGCQRLLPDESAYFCLLLWYDLTPLIVCAQ